MTTPSLSRPTRRVQVLAMTVFTLSMLWSVSIHGEFDWKTLVSIVLWGITIGLWTWVAIAPQRTTAEPGS